MAFRCARSALQTVDLAHDVLGGRLGLHGAARSAGRPRAGWACAARVPKANGVASSQDAMSAASRTAKMRSITRSPAGRAAPRRRASPCARARSGRGGPRGRARARSPCARRVPIALIILPAGADQDPLLGLGLGPHAGARRPAGRPRAPRSPRPPPRPRAAAPRACAAAPARAPARPAAPLGQVAASSGGYRNGPSGSSSTSARRSSDTPVPFGALIGKISPCRSSSAAAGSASTVRARSSWSTLFTAITTGTPRRAQRRGDEAVAGADLLLAVEHEQRGVGVVQLALHPALHPLGEHVARALHARAGRPARAASRRRWRCRGSRAGWSAACRRRSRPCPPTIAVDQRRLADVRPAGERDEAGAGLTSPSITRSWSASISPSSVSWS